MPTLTIAPFRDELLDQAASLLAARHRAQRAHEPLLPERFGAPEGARAVVTAAWGEEQTSGMAALRGERLVGFLIGAPRMDATWGRSAWVRLGGHALAADENPDTYRDLYAALAPEWLALGCFVHYALIPASDRSALDAWFALSFGQQQAYALRALPASDVAPPLDPSITVRRAGPDDLEGLLEVADVVARHQARSPVYAAFLPEMRNDRHADYAELLADSDAAIWIAERGGSVLGFTLFLPDAPSDGALYVPEHCVELVLAATRGEERGNGIGRALAARGLAWAAESGYTACATDWRTTNLLASRFWPRQRFRPVAYRLERRIDQRIAWANGSNVQSAIHS